MATPPAGCAVTVIGECVADAFTEPPEQAAPSMTLRVHAGGGPANTAATLARLGTPTHFLGRFSEDALGTLFRTRLGAAGVDLGGSVSAPEHSTLALADIDPAGRATYTFYAEGAADWQWTADELPPRLPRGTVCVHTGSLALVRPPGGAAIERYLAGVREHTTVSIDPNVRPGLVPPEDYHAGMPRWCALTDILRLSEDDLGHLLPGAALPEACDVWHEAGASLVVVTRGADGVLASLNGSRVTVSSPSVDVVDTVGAGDAFTAGLLHRLATLGRLGGRLDGLTPDEVSDACAHAARLAALTCTVPGADPQLAPLR